MLVWNSNQTIESLLGFGFRDATIEYSVNGVDYTTLGNAHEFARASGTAGYAHNTTIDFGGTPARCVLLTANSNWGGILPQYGLSEVRFLQIPVIARKPYPESGATSVDADVVLNWRAGREAATHYVYLSTDEQSVIDTTAIAAMVTDASYNPMDLALNTSYYWKVVEVNESEQPSTWESNIWNFTMNDHIVVEDFDDYTDWPGFEIYATWLDGYENPTNGSQVGYLLPPLAETTIVHGGRQSMPFFYNNKGSALFSQTERTFEKGQDWTKHGVNTLMILFYGATGNTGQLYMKINGVKIPYYGAAGNVAIEEWQAWNIDLTALGLDLHSVTTMAIGIDGNGADGALYFDDIRLYP